MDHHKKIEMINSSMFYAKILLFGEYGIIEDSMGLSIPFDNFNGRFRFVEPSEADDNQIRSNKSIAKYVKHLKQMHFTGQLPCKFDFARKYGLKDN